MSEAQALNMIMNLRPTMNETLDDPVVTMRDRFALAIVTGDTATGDPNRAAHASNYARMVYDFADALDNERRRRNAEEGK